MINNREELAFYKQEAERLAKMMEEVVLREGRGRECCVCVWVCVGEREK
jgi:hypothetical protein